MGEIAVGDVTNKLAMGTGYHIEDAVSCRYRQTWVVFGKDEIEIRQRYGIGEKNGGSGEDVEWYCKLSRPDFNTFMATLAKDEGSIGLGKMNVTETYTPMADGIPQEPITRTYPADLTLRLIRVNDRTIIELEKTEPSPAETRNTGRA